MDSSGTCESPGGATKTIENNGVELALDFVENEKCTTYSSTRKRGFNPVDSAYGAEDGQRIVICVEKAKNMIEQKTSYSSGEVQITKLSSADEATVVGAGILFRN